MLDAIGRGEIIERRFFLRAGHEGVDRFGIAIGEEDGAGIGTQGSDQPRAVVLFIATRLFVLLDDVPFVVLDVADGGDASLDVVSHALLVEINAGLRLANESAVRLEGEEVLPGPFAYTASE